MGNLYIYCPQQSWGKVIFSEACVKNSVNRGACMARGVHGKEDVWWGACVAGVGDMHGRGMCGRGVCIAGDLHGRGG